MMDAVALGGALYGLVQPAVQFESVMADVKKVVNFDTPDQFGQMSKDVLLMSTRIPMAADGIGAIVAAAGQAGIAREELLRFAEDAAKMGVAFDLSGQQAGAAMTGLRSIFGLTQDEVVKLGDAINHLSNNMDAKASDLLNIANRAGSTAKLFRPVRGAAQCPGRDLPGAQDATRGGGHRHQCLADEAGDRRQAEREVPAGPAGHRAVG